jgi:hypothetical protein
VPLALLFQNHSHSLAARARKRTTFGRNITNAIFAFNRDLQFVPASLQPILSPCLQPPVAPVSYTTSLWGRTTSTSQFLNLPLQAFPVAYRGWG